MKPVLFTFPWLDMPVYGYGVMLGLSFVFGWYFILFTARWYGLKEDVYIGAMILAAIFSLVGARLVFILANGDQVWTLARMLNIREGGLVAYGGYILGIGAGVLHFLRRRVPVWSYLDAATPALALGLMFTRLGCFLRGCCFGARTDSLIGLSFPPPSLAAEQHTARGWPLAEDGSTTPIIPTQLVESLAGLLLALLVGAVLWRLRQARHATTEGRPPTGPGARLRDGHPFLIFVTGYSLFRFGIEFLRDDWARGSVGLLSTSQFIGLVLVAAALFAIWHRARQPLLSLETAPPSRSQRRRNSPKPRGRR